MRLNHETPGFCSLPCHCLHACLHDARLKPLGLVRAFVITDQEWENTGEEQGSTTVWLHAMLASCFESLM